MGLTLKSINFVHVCIGTSYVANRKKKSDGDLCESCVCDKSHISPSRPRLRASRHQSWIISAMCRDIDSGTRWDTRGHTQDNKFGQQISFSGKYQQRGLYTERQWDKLLPQQTLETFIIECGNHHAIHLYKLKTIFIFIWTLFYYTHININLDTKYQVSPKFTRWDFSLSSGI